MKVTTYKTVDVEVEVDVNVDDLLSECFDRADKPPEAWRQVLSSLDTATKILARVREDTIAKFSDEAAAILHERLTTQARRYDRKLSERQQEV